jgi:hypothetical protein
VYFALPVLGVSRASLVNASRRVHNIINDINDININDLSEWSKIASSPVADALKHYDDENKEGNSS